MVVGFQRKKSPSRLKFISSELTLTQPWFGGLPIMLDKFKNQGDKTNGKTTENPERVKNGLTRE